MRDQWPNEVTPANSRGRRSRVRNFTLVAPAAVAEFGRSAREISMLPPGRIEVRDENSKNPQCEAAFARLRQLGVSVLDRHSTQGYDYELRLPLGVKYPEAVLVEIGYLLAQLTDHKFPEEYDGFSSSSGAVPHWKPRENLGEREGIRFDVDPAYMYFRFDLRR